MNPAFCCDFSLDKLPLSYRLPQPNRLVLDGKDQKPMDVANRQQQPVTPNFVSFIVPALQAARNLDELANQI